MCDYSNLSSPLPSLPTGHYWVRNDETREWYVSVDEATMLEKDTKGEFVQDSAVDMEGRTNLPDDCDYLQHQVQKSDTFQGICLKYGISPVALRQTNNFSGSNLLFAPELLIIPLARTLARKSKVDAENGLSASSSKEHKLNQFLLTFRNHTASDLVSRKEAQAYLDMNDGNLEMAIKDAKADFGWELNKDKAINETTGLLIS